MKEVRYPVERPFVGSYRSALNLYSAVSAGKAATEYHQKKRLSYTSGLLLSIDVVLWGVLFFACAGIFGVVKIPLFLPNPWMLAVPFCVSVFGGWLVGAYDRDTTFVSLRFSTEALIAGLIATGLGPGLVALFGNYGGAFQTSRLFLFVLPSGFTILSILVRRRLYRRLRGERGLRQVIIIGNAWEAQSVENALRLTSSPMKVKVIGPVEAGNGELEDVLFPELVAGETSQKREAPVVVIAPSGSGTATGPIKPLLVALHSSSVPVYSWSAFWNQRLRMYDCHSDCIEWLFDKDFQMHTSSVYWHVKRLTDIVVALTGIILTLPLLLVAAIAIALECRGGIFFRQERVGLRGNLFTVLKLRTMRNGSETNGATTVENDPRVTRVGRILRKYRIDEVPQLFNVLTGEMSIVGPRPEWTVCVERYENAIPGYHLRHLVKPGITGWAQVNFPYGENVEDAKTKLAFDLHYVTHASLVVDCSIILKTLYVLMGRVGAR